MKALRSFGQRLRGISVAVLAAMMGVGSVASAQASNSESSGQLQVDFYGMMSQPLLGSTTFVAIASVAALAAVGLHRAVVSEARQEEA